MFGWASCFELMPKSNEFFGRIDQKVLRKKMKKNEKK